jgi:hypothetical protein
MPGSSELLVIFCVFFSIAIVPVIFFLLTLQNCLERCHPSIRTMNPGEVWFMLIPIFNMIWQFIVVLRIASTLESEFKRRNIVKEPEPGKAIGLTWCILDVCAMIPVIGVIPGIAALICWIIYWIKISGYSTEIATQFPQNA